MRLVDRSREPDRSATPLPTWVAALYFILAVGISLAASVWLAA